MRRRDLIALIGGVAMALPLRVRAQSSTCRRQNRSGSRSRRCCLPAPTRLSN